MDGLDEQSERTYVRMDERMDGRADECPCAIDYKDSLRDRQGESGKVMQTNGNVITFISTVARSTSSTIKRRKLRRRVDIEKCVKLM